MTTRPKVSIVIPHYQTPDLARLCLRAVRRRTHGVSYEVIVVDNGSTDGESLDYLRQVEGIRLIERGPIPSSKGLAHREAVDIGFEAASGELLLAMHTDTVPLTDDWLAWHVDRIERDDRIAAVGTDKLELRGPIEAALKTTEDWLTFWKKLRPYRMANRRKYIRSHCALYRRSVLDQLGLHYNDGSPLNAGQSVHYALEAAGYVAELLDVRDVIRRVVHLKHGTMVLRPELGAAKSTIRKGHRRLAEFMERPDIQAVLHDESLDRLPNGPFLQTAEKLVA